MRRELLLFRTGAIWIARGSFDPGLDAPARDEMVLRPVWSALIRTEDETVLFDTGIDPVHVERPTATFDLPHMKVAMARADAVVARLEAVGVRPDDVTVVVNSHLHFDHAGNNGAFPAATFIVQREHLDYARAHRENFARGAWDLPGLRYAPVSGPTPIAAGVEVVPTPGHAPGHQSLVVELPETGRVVLCGDAARTRADLERCDTVAADVSAARRSLRLIRSLVDDDLERAFPSHDEVAWSRWRHAPAAYR